MSSAAGSAYTAYPSCRRKSSGHRRCASSEPSTPISRDILSDTTSRSPIPTESTPAHATGRERHDGAASRSTPRNADGCFTAAAAGALAGGGGAFFARRRR